MTFVLTLRDVLLLSLLGLFLIAWVGLWGFSFLSLLVCKLRGHRYRSPRPEPFAPCLRCGRRTG